MGDDEIERIRRDLGLGGHHNIYESDLPLFDDACALLAEVDRLRECMRVAGLQAFMRGRSPEEVAEHLRSVADSWVAAGPEAAESMRRRAVEAALADDTDYEAAARIAERIRALPLVEPEE